jgi:hypothetical protein
VLQHAIDQVAGIDHSASGHGQVESGAHVGASDASTAGTEHLGGPRPDVPAVDSD